MLRFDMQRFSRDSLQCVVLFELLALSALLDHDGADANDDQQ